MLHGKVVRGGAAANSSDACAWTNTGCTRLASGALAPAPESADLKIRREGGQASREPLAVARAYCDIPSQGATFRRSPYGLSSLVGLVAALSLAFLSPLIPRGPHCHILTSCA